MDDITDKIIRAYSRLNSLKQNLPSNGPFGVHEKYVIEYHSIVDELQNITKMSLSEFKVPLQEVKQTSISESYPKTKEKFCERNFLMAKIDALLEYFQIKYLSQEKREIGFKTE